MTARPRIRLVALGALDRGDDGLGPLAVAELPEPCWPLVDVRVESSLDVTDLADVARGGGCVVVDAARGIPPGEVRFLPFTSFLDRRRGALPEPRSSHELPVDALLRVAKSVRGELPWGGFIVAGGRNFGFGALPSPEIALAVPKVVAAIQNAIDRYARTRRRPSGLRDRGTVGCA